MWAAAARGRTVARMAATNDLLLLTVGHSTRSVEQLVALLRTRDVATLIDIRRFPASRRQPWFDRDALGGTLAEGGIAYAWLEALGGRRRVQPGSPNGGWRNAAFQGYADYMATEEFAAGVASLLLLARAGRACVMCAEALPWRCHRWLLSDWLVAHGARVAHIVGPGPTRTHKLTDFAHLDTGQLTYPPQQAQSESR